MPTLTPIVILALLTPALLSPAFAATPQESPEVVFHLTARPWKPLNIPDADVLDRIEGIVRFTAKLQDADGAIIDPFTKKEHQYATPYYAHALGALLRANKARDLLASGIRAMDWSTQCFRDNHTNGHRVFFATPLAESLDLYAPFVPADKLAVWRDRLKAQIALSEAGDNNWTTYRMKGEWARVKAGLIDRAAAVDVIENCWRPIQRSRIVDTPGHLYHDLTTTPDTLAVEAIGRVNLLALIADGYDGPSAKEITDAAEAGTRTSLLTQDPSGQMPCNGRTDDHVWGDVGYQLAFDVMAER